MDVVTPLIAVNLPTTIIQRLGRQGLSGHVLTASEANSHLVPENWCSVNDLAELATLPAPRIWVGDLPMEFSPAPTDLLVCTGPYLHFTGYRSPARRCTVALQDSPYAIEHGFLLAAGGEANNVLAARDIMDALAPLPNGWLHAGGVCAPHFLATVATTLGGGLGNLAAVMSSVALSGPAPLWAGQQALIMQLAALAADYLRAEGDEPYQAAHPLPPAFGSAMQFSGRSPAQTIAGMIMWLSGHAANLQGNA
jgi:hypothetical protein